MNDSKLYNLLGSATHEIEILRARVASLTPKADAYDRIGQVLDLVSGNGVEGVYGEDVLWGLRIATEEIQSRLAQEKYAGQTRREEKPSPERDTFADIQPHNLRRTTDEETAQVDNRDASQMLRAAIDQDRGTLGTVTASADLSGVSQRVGADRDRYD